MEKNKKSVILVVSILILLILSLVIVLCVVGYNGRRKKHNTKTTTEYVEIQRETTEFKEEITKEEIFNHPGILHTEESFEYMKYAVENKVYPNYDTYIALLNSPLSNAEWYPRPVETVIRGGNGDNVSKLYIDVARAYQCALIWKISGSEAHGEAACRILNAWSSTLKTVSGNGDRYLAAGLFGYQLANVSEIMREHPLFEKEQMKKMLLEVFYKPMNERFLIGNEYGYDHNDAYVQNYWSNWDLCNMASAVAIGIFCENEEAYNVGIDYFRNGRGNGSIYNAIPFIFEDGTAQWQESGRDQGHTNLGLGLMTCVCEMAWNQGDDIYSMADNRLMKAAEYIARYNNGNDVAFSQYEWGSGKNGTVNYHTIISSSGRGEIRPIWSMIYNHYVNRLGLSLPNVKERLDSFVYEYGAVSGGHATTYDQPGWGTLTYAGNKGNMEATPVQGDLEEGTYIIKSVHTGKVLTVSDIFDNIGVVAQRAENTSSSQFWQVESCGDGEYLVKNVETGMYLEVSEGTHTSGALIQAGSKNEKAYQRFGIIKTNNIYRIICSISGKAVDIRDWSEDDSAQIIQWRYLGGDNQHWMFIKQ